MCTQGCPTGAKQSMLIHLFLKQKNGLRILHNCKVEKFISKVIRQLVLKF